MVKSVFSLILHSPYVALDLSIPIAKKPTTPARRSHIPSTSSGRLLEMHSNMVEEVEELIKHKRFSSVGFFPTPFGCRAIQGFLSLETHKRGALKRNRILIVNELRRAEGVAQAKIHARERQGEQPTGETLQAAVSRPLGRSHSATARDLCRYFL